MTRAGAGAGSHRVDPQLLSELLYGRQVDDAHIPEIPVMASVG
jgi:hypothetical protein